MPEPDLDRTVLVVAGVSLRAEQMDRTLAYRVADEIRQRLAVNVGWQPLVISDVLYLNAEPLTRCPIISIGGPGVNKLSAVLFEELPSVLTIDHTLIIQMELDQEPRRCCIWGGDHDRTVDAVDLFCKMNYLDTFLAGVTGRTVDPRDE